MVRQKVPTSDPNCPEHIRFAKCVYQKIIRVIHASTGGSDTAGGDLFTNGEVCESDVDPEEDKMGENAEEGNVLGGNDGITPTTTLFTSANINDLNADADEESGGVEDVLNTSISTETSRQGESTAGRSGAREKRPSASLSAGGGTQQSQPLQIPRKSPVPPSGDSDEGDSSNMYLFGNMMSMMMKLVGQRSASFLSPKLM
jgi:hypothetical protein